MVIRSIFRFEEMFPYLIRLQTVSTIVPAYPVPAAFSYAKLRKAGVLGVLPGIIGVQSSEMWSILKTGRRLQENALRRCIDDAV